MALLITAMVVTCVTAMSQTNEPVKKSSAELMHEMRLKMLTSFPSDFGQKPTADFPRARGVLMDWPIENGIVSVVSLSTGDASIYTTGTFGVIGGIGHPNVRLAATIFVKTAEKHYEDSVPTKDFPYPKAGRIRFYIVTYDGVRTIDTDLESVKGRTNKLSDLFVAGQRVISELRLTIQSR
jgi:hypothetical protein